MNAVLYTCVIQLDQSNNALKLTYSAKDYQKFPRREINSQTPAAKGCRDAAVNVPRLTQGVEMGGVTEGGEGWINVGCHQIANCRTRFK